MEKGASGSKLDWRRGTFDLTLSDYKKKMNGQFLCILHWTFYIILNKRSNFKTADIHQVEVKTMIMNLKVAPWYDIFT